MLFSGAVALTLASLLISSSDAITVPLSKRDPGITQANGAVNIAAIKQETNRLQVKYQRNSRAVTSNSAAVRQDGRIQQVAKRGSVPLQIADYAIWTGSVAIGTPAQNFQIYFDTGSSDFTVASTACGTSCGTKNRYNVASSSTANRTSTSVTTNFVDGTSSSGNLVYDKVTAGGLTASSQAVIAASSLSSTVASIKSDGMGLAYPSLSQAYSSSLQFTLTNEGQGNVPYFGLRLSNTPGQSALTFSGYQRNKITGTPRFFNVAKDDSNTSFNTYWQIGFSTWFANGVQANRQRVNFILDSGTTLILAPYAAAAEFYSHIPGSALYDDGIYTFPCDSTPTVEASFARITLQKYAVNPEDFNLGYTEEDPNQCVGALMGANLGIGSSYILGDVFLLSHYVIHNVRTGQIGLATPRFR
ncbi:pepsin-like aspartic protease [Sporobolomyces salmoneus]|uniref:pepsin-like aspartic protease n=1 Tax=Sporobolomyces salmoneus TaxID=183962 RepID=UPI003179E802